MKKGVGENAWNDDPEKAKKAARDAVLAKIKSKGGVPTGASDAGVVWDRGRNTWKAWSYQEYKEAGK